MIAVQERNAWISTLTATIINTCAMTAIAITAMNHPGWPSWHAWSAAAFSGVLFITLLILRKRATLRICGAIYLMNNICAVTALYIGHPYVAAQGPNWIPFQGNKISCLIAALLAPTFPVGVTAISLMSGSAIFQFFTFPPELRATFPIGEPTAMIVFAMVGFMLLWFRMRRIALERELIFTHAQAASAKKFARVLLQLRDLTNSPLQTLEFSIELLRRKPTDTPVALERMTHALDHLRKIDGVLNQYESHIGWESVDLALEQIPAIDPLLRRD